MILRPAAAVMNALLSFYQNTTTVTDNDGGVQLNLQCTYIICKLSSKKPKSTPTRNCAFELACENFFVARFGLTSDQIVCDTSGVQDFRSAGTVNA